MMESQTLSGAEKIRNIERLLSKARRETKGSYTARSKVQKLGKKYNVDTSRPRVDRRMKKDKAASERSSKGFRSRRSQKNSSMKQRKASRRR